MKDKVSLKELVFPTIIIFFIILIFYFARKTFFTLILSIAFSYLLNPLVRFFEVRGIKRIYTVSIFYLSVGILFMFLGLIIVKIARFDVDSFFNNWPFYYSKFENIFTTLVSRMISIFPFLSQFKFEEKILNFLVLVPNYVLSFVPYTIFLFIIPFVSFFILIKGSDLLDVIVEHIPSRYVEIIYHVISRIDNTLGNYLRGIITEAFIVFLLAFFGLFFININYFSILAVIVGFSSIVPYLGAFVGVVISSTIAYLQYGNVYVVLKVVILFGIIRFIDDWFLQPYIIKKSININPAFVVLALMAGGEIAGFWGVVFALPIVCIIREIVNIIIELYKTEFMWKPQPKTVKIEIPYT